MDVEQESALQPSGDHSEQVPEVASALTTDIVSLILRVTFGVIFLGHATQKLGWFKGGGYPTSISTQADFVKFMGYDHTHLMAWLITLTEAASGILLLAGLCTPLAVAGMLGVNFQFIAGVQWNFGLFGNTTGGSGFELPLMMSAGIAALGFVGAGRFSVDHKLRWNLRGPRWGLAAIALAVVAGSIVLVGFGLGFGGQPTFPAKP